MDVPKDAEEIWDAVQRAQLVLATRGEERSTSDWIAAVVNRANGLRIASGPGAAWSQEDILYVWLIVNSQELAKWKGVAARLAMEMKTEQMRTPPDGPPPDGTREAVMLQEGHTAGGDLITREVVESSFEQITPGQPVGNAQTQEVEYTITRVWLHEVDGKLTLSAWMLPVAAVPAESRLH